LKIRYWGVRGSIAVPGPDTVLTGGNTPCISLTLSDGALLILDGGTGLRALGRALMARPEFASGRGRATFLFTHRHWDHIQGVPFFEPAYVPGNQFDVCASDHVASGAPLLDNVVSLQHNMVNFPVPFDVVRRAYRFHGVHEGVPFDLPAARVLPVRLNHAGVTLGYVVTETATNARLAYLCDTAPWDDVLLGDGMDVEGRPDAVGRRQRDLVVAAARDADLVIHDTFFDDAGYQSRKTWGHSTPHHALEFCRLASARRLHLFHFAPDLDDAAVARLAAETAAEALASPGGIEVSAAREGMELTLP